VAGVKISIQHGYPVIQVPRLPKQRKLHLGYGGRQQWHRYL